MLWDPCDPKRRPCAFIRVLLGCIVVSVAMFCFYVYALLMYVHHGQAPCKSGIPMAQRLRPQVKASCSTARAHPRPTPYTAHHSHPPRLQRQREHAAHSLAQHEPARHHDQPDIPLPPCALHPPPPRIFDSAPDEAGKREGGRVEEADGKCDAGGDVGRPGGAGP
jgi:hypothetical protein